MEIVTERVGDGLEVKVKGRLDGYWADHLRSSLEEVIRGGAHRVQLNLAGVSYLSSAGVGLLVLFQKQLQGIDGSFIIVHPSEPVKRVINLCGLSALLLASPAPTPAVARKTETRRLETAGGVFEVTESSPDALLRCEVIGDPGPLSSGQFQQHHCRAVAFPPSALGLGLGAFGEGFEEAQARFGEFVAVAGSAAYLPTDGTNVPDYMVSAGALVPELNVLYGVRLEGEFTHVVRFEAAAGAVALKLGELVETCLDISGRDAVGMAWVAESAGLVGAALRRSPALGAAASAPFEYPEVRRWLSFSTERLYARSLAVVCGVAARAEQPALAPLLRPLGNREWPRGHFHAAALSYRPLMKGRLDLKTTVNALFESENLQSVLHLLTDDRASGGHEQSEFVRGTCWIGTLPEASLEVR